MKDMTHAQASFKRADRLYHGAIKFFFVFAFIMLCVIAFQVANLSGNFTKSQEQEVAQRDEDTAAARGRLEKALEETQRQQVVTQNYVRCVASILLKPEKDRSVADFDACGIPGVTDPDNLGQPNTNQGVTAPNQQSPAITPSTPAPSTQSTQPTQQQPVAGGSPPDDNDVTPTPEEDRSALGRLPVVGDLLNAIGL